MTQHLVWTVLIIFACVSCFFGVRRDTFWFAMLAGVAAIALAFNGWHELNMLLDVMEGQARQIRLNLEVGLAGLLWITRTNRWLAHG